MLVLEDRPRLGRYILARPLADGPFGRRTLALDEAGATSHVISELSNLGDAPAAPHDVAAVVESLRALDHAHVLPIEAVEAPEPPDAGAVRVVAPFTGDSTGIVTLAIHLRAKGGFLSPLEAFEAVGHLLSASDYAHRRGFRHGPLTLDEVLVDRRGSLLVELYGLRAGLLGTPGGAELEREEIRSIVRLGYQLVTGLLPEEPLISAGRVVPGLGRGWDDWFETGLAAGPGFKSAAHALSALAAGRFDAPMTRGVGVGRVRSVLNRLLGAGGR